MTSIATLSLDAVRADGREFTLHIRVGAPFVSDRLGSWVCSLTLHPLNDLPLDVAGEGSLHALTLALRTARELLEDFTDKGGKLAMEGETFPLDSWFGLKL